MAFPTITVEVSFEDPFDTPVWTDISEFLRGFNSGRGRQYELDRFEAGTLGILLGNADSRFTPDNTQSPYWPDVVPMRRVRVRATDPVERLPGGLLLDGTSGTFASTPDSAALSVTGDLDIRVRVALDDWTPTGGGALVVKRTVADGLSFQWVVDGTGVAVFSFNDGSSNHFNDANSGVFGFTDGTTHWLRVTRDTSGNYEFFKSDDNTNDHTAVSWTSLGTASGTAGNIADTAAPVEIGSSRAGTFERLNGKVYAAAILDGIGGTVVADPVFADSPWEVGDAAPTARDDGQGNTWTLNGNAEIDGASETHSICDGFVEDWAQAWPGQGSDSIVRLTASDAFQVLALDDLGGSYKAEVLADEPVGYWPLNELSGTTADDETDNALDGAYTGGPTLGGANFSHGGGRTSVEFAGLTQWLDLGAPAALQTDHITVEAWVNLTSSDIESAIIYNVGLPSRLTGVFLWISEATVEAGGGGDPEGLVRFTITTTSGTVELLGPQINDGEWHHVAATYDGSRVVLHVDSVAVEEASLTGTIQYDTGDASIGGRAAEDFSDATINASDVAHYSTALTPGRIAAHHAAKFDQAPAERSDLRIGKILDTIGWPSGERDLEEGQTDVLALTADSQNVLGALQAVNTSEAGQLFIGTDGKVVFHDRHHRVLVLNESQVTFGDADSEDPNRYRELEPNTDLERLANIIEITSDGAVQVFEDEDSRGKYGSRRLPLDLQVSSTEAEARGHYELHRRANASTRLERLLIRPQYDPDLWAQALGREIGDRVTTIRRLPDGDTWTQTGVIEHVEHRSTASPQLWETVWALSPADEDEWWVLGDADLSLLGETTRVGYAWALLLGAAAALAGALASAGAAHTVAAL